MKDTAEQPHESMQIDRFPATSRFTKSYDDSKPDQLIDFFIAFEALFCKIENRYKGNIIGDSCSKLIAKNNEEKKEIKETLVEGYKLRNNVVHGNAEEQDQLWELNPKIEEYLRRALILRVTQLHQAIPK